jgi:AraC-like DNA-binding protein
MCFFSTIRIIEPESALELYFFDIYDLMTPPLDDLGFQLISPSMALRSHVRSFWYFKRETRLDNYREEFMHPNGGYGIVFNFGDPLRLNSQVLTAPVFLDGTNTASSKMGFIGVVEQIGISFWVGGAYPVLGLPLSELHNLVLPFGDLDKAVLNDLYGRLIEARSLSARVSILEQWLLHRLNGGRERHAIIPASLDALRSAKGQLPIPALAEQFYISQRQLERLYQMQVGMSPKQYTGLLRVEAARLALKDLHGRSTTDLAMDLGFYDQAHFIREFSAVVGMTPHQYWERSRQRVHWQPDSA